MDDKKGSRRLVVLSISPTEFFVKGEGTESDVRNVVQNVLPDTEFSISAVKDSETGGIQSRLKPQQQEILKNLNTQAAGASLQSYRVEFKKAPPIQKSDELSEKELAGVAGGALMFNPEIMLISRPLINPGRPVGITVGVGIAGKF